MFFNTNRFKFRKLILTSLLITFSLLNSPVSFASNQDSALVAKAHYFELDHKVDSAAFYYRKAAINARRKKQFERSDHLFDKSIALLVNSDDTIHLKGLVNTYINKSYGQFLRGDYLGSKSSLEPAVDICNEISHKTAYEAYFAFRSLGNIYTRLGEYERASLMIDEARQIIGKELLDKTKDTSAKRKLSRRLAITLNDLSLVYASQEDFPKAISILKKGVDLPDVPVDVYGLLYATIAKYFFSLEQPDSALISIEKAVSIYDDLLEKNEPGFTVYNWGFQIYALAGEITGGHQGFDRSIAYFEKALKTSDHIFENRNRREFAKLFIAYGDVLSKAGQHRSGMEKYQQALHCVIPDLPETSFPNPEEQQLYAENSIVEALIGKAGSYEYFYENDADIEHLKKALKCYWLAFKAEDKLWEFYEFESSKLRHLSLSRKQTEKAIDVAYQLFDLSGDQYYAEAAFEFAERSKSILLLEGIRKNLSSRLYAKTDTLFREEKKLKKELARYIVELIELKRDGLAKEDGQRSKLENLKKQTENKLISLNQVIGKRYPLFSRLTSATHAGRLKAVRQRLLSNNETVLIEYFIGASNSYVFKVIKDSDPELFKIPYAQELGERVDRYLAFFTSADAIINRSEEFSETAFELYDKLFGFLKLRKGSRVILIPDDKLNLLPFDALFTAPHVLNNFQRAPYLVFDHPIRLAYSAALLLDTPIRKSDHRSFLAMAPVFESQHRQLNTLRYSAEEVKDIEAPNLSVFIAQKANLNAFRRLAESSFIIHLSTHAEAGEYGIPPHIEFYDSSLYLPELYNMDLSGTELVVLSACQTGLGKIEKGEGVMSLSRGFTYAGSNSLISSLWSVNEASTAKLFKNFYNELKSGASKAESFHSSKLAFLSDESNPDLTKSPYYWAGFVYIGQDGTIDMESNWSPYIFAFGAFLALALIIAFKKPL